MAEYIDRERLKQCFHANICGGNAYDELIDMQPTADVIEREKIDNSIELIKQEIENGVIKIASGNERLFNILRSTGE